VPEPVVPPLARAAIDRDAAHRSDPGRADAFDADPASRVLALHAGRVLLALRVDGAAPEVELRHPSELPEASLRAYLGRTLDAHGGAGGGAASVDGSGAWPADAASASNPAPGTRIELRVFDEASARAIEPDATRWAGLRTVAPLLGDRDAGLLTEAVALANWHARHSHCPLCGAPTRVVEAGWSTRCTVDDSQHFPRTDPAVIVLVTDDAGRVLLGSNAMWEQDRFSVLAGFVEPGESLEAAVVREIGEEAGLAVDRVDYLGSQPWPFPASLMCAFAARVAPGSAASAATPDGEEILELRWFSREELTAALDSVALPGETSIARWMLERWYGRPLASSMPWTSS
jgi:NAD+ diphosphatase